MALFVGSEKVIDTKYKQLKALINLSKIAKQQHADDHTATDETFHKLF